MIGTRAARTSSGPAAHATAAPTGRIHDRSKDPRPHSIKALANRGPSIHDGGDSKSAPCALVSFEVARRDPALPALVIDPTPRRGRHVALCLAHAHPLLQRCLITAAAEVLQT